MNSSQPIVMQIVLSFIALLGLERVVSRQRRRQLGIGVVVLWIIGAAIFLVFVWRPDLATRLSNAIGVGRGVDAALYIAVAVLFYATLRIFIRLEQQEHLITKLVSEIALLRHELREKK